MYARNELGSNFILRSLEIPIVGCRVSRNLEIVGNSKTEKCVTQTTVPAQDSTDHTTNLHADARRGLFYLHASLILMACMNSGLTENLIYYPLSR